MNKKLVGDLRRKIKGKIKRVNIPFSGLSNLISLLASKSTSYASSSIPAKSKQIKQL
jgi:hypothetical protein